VRRRILVAAVVATLLPTSGRADDRDARRARLLVTGFDGHVLEPARRSDASPTAQGRVWSDRVKHTSTTPIAIHAVASAPAAAPAWSLRVLDRDRRQVEVLRHDAPCWTAGGGCWTMPVAGGEAEVELWTEGPADGVAVVLDMYRSARAPSANAATVGDDDKVQLVQASFAAQQLAPPVVRLSIQTSGAYCTGFLVTSDLVLTNEHCIANDADALSTTVDFKYERPQPLPKHRMRVVKLEALDPGLDYALLRLQGKAPSEYGRLRIDRATLLTTATTLIVIQHPGGSRKMVAERNCGVSALDVPGVGPGVLDFGHSCDTLQGSSGAPVLASAGGRVVGLHHWGFDEHDEPHNQAVRIGLVLDHIAHVRQRPDLVSEIDAP
jgi:hypothetical protein